MEMNAASAAIQAQWDRQADAERRGRFDRRSSTFVYVIAEVGSEGFVKIGLAQDVPKRLCGLQSSCPRPLEVIATFLCSTRVAARFHEKAAHTHFAAARLRGEWFSITRESAVEFLSASLAEDRIKSMGNETRFGGQFL